MALTTITSSNAVMTLTAVGLFPAPIQIDGWSSDSSFTHDAAELAEVQMGVDGRMTAGYTPTVRTQTLKLQADSPSRALFNVLTQTMEVQREIVWLSGSISIPSVGEVYTFTKGVIQSSPAALSAQKVLQPVEYKIVWESVKSSLI